MERGGVNHPPCWAPIVLMMFTLFFLGGSFEAFLKCMCREVYTFIVLAIVDFMALAQTMNYTRLSPPYA